MYDKVMEAVARHHRFVEEAGYHVVMTVLVGSQNYKLNDEKSDVDTFSFVFPSFNNLVTASQPVIDELCAEDGNCYIKDMRTAFHLLRRASPNSVEYFTSKYKVFNPMYKDIFDEYLKDGYNSKLWYMIHCDYDHMLDAMAGMARQLTVRNMPAGKRYSHALRLQDMGDRFLSGITAGSILDMLSNNRVNKALAAKRDSKNEEFYNAECLSIADDLKKLKTTYNKEMVADIERYGMQLIEQFQNKLFAKYLQVLVEDTNALRS